MSYSGKVNIHIGMHKTATSTLQQLFKQSYERNCEDFLYPMSGRMENWPVAHHKLISDFNARDFKSHDDLLKEINDFTESNNGNVVISCEDYSFTDNFGALLYLLKRLSNYEVEIFIAFRDYVSWFESFYLERAKRRETELDPMSFVRENFNKHKYSLIINFLEQVGVKLNFINYSSETFIHSTYKDIVGFDLDDSIKVHHWNQGYSYPMTRVLMDMYKDNPELNIDKTIQKAFHMENFLGLNKKDFPVFDDDESQQIVDFLFEEREILNCSIPGMVDYLFSFKSNKTSKSSIPENDNELMHYLFKSFVIKDN